MTPYVDGEFIDPAQVGEGQLTEEQHMYKENILDHYRNPRNKRTMQDATARYKDTNPFCGDEIEVMVRIENDEVSDIAFQGKGCAISQASMSMLSKKLKGKSKDEVARLGPDYVLSMLGIPIGIVRRKCAMLGLRVTQKALEVSNAGN